MTREHMTYEKLIRKAKRAGDMKLVRGLQSGILNVVPNPEHPDNAHLTEKELQTRCWPFQRDPN